MSDPAPPTSSPTVGVFLCSCAGTLDECLDLDMVARRVSAAGGAAVAGVFPVLCSATGREILRRESVARGFRRVVVAGCTPLEHGEDFRTALGEAGVNPYLVRVANIREQGAWLTADRERATAKACTEVMAAVARVRHQQPLTRHTVDAVAAVVVVGAGAAGISAALALAEGGRRVTLLEQEHHLGGRAYHYRELYPARECGSCLLGPPVDEVLHHPEIEVVTGARVEACRGQLGRFQLEVRVRPRGVAVDSCLGCGACTAACPVAAPRVEGGPRSAIDVPFDGALPHAPVVDRQHCLRCAGETCDACVDACPTGAARPARPEETRSVVAGAVVLAAGFGCFDPKKDPRFGASGEGRVLSAPAVEAWLAASAATGSLTLADGAMPASVALVHCVGSRSERFHRHCSAICCAYLGKLAAQFSDLLPGVRIIDLYVDHCLPGPSSERFFGECLAGADVELRRRRSADEVEILPEADAVRLRYVGDHGGWEELRADLAVLAPALLGPSDAEELAEVFGVGADAAGFLAEGPDLLARNASRRPGVYLAGGCRAPGDVRQAVADGLAAAGQVFRQLVPGQTVELEPAVAAVDPERCSGCGVCLAACEFGAVTVDRERVAAVDGELCRGCGSCAAACPSGAICQQHTTDTQLLAEVAVLALSGADGTTWR